MLVDIFEQICDVVDPGAENPGKRATHAIERLRDQRMLARVDCAGIVGAMRKRHIRRRRFVDRCKRVGESAR